MVGTSGGTLGGRERIVIVDELLPGRLKRAARRHILRRPQLWRSILVICLSVVTVLVVSALADGHTRALTAAMLGLPAFVILTVAAVMGSTMMTVGRRIDREFVAGRLIGLTIGSHTIRFRDHDSCVEYAYSCVRGIEKLGDVIVITVSSSFWLVPTEMLDGVSLEVLRTVPVVRSPTARPGPTRRPEYARQRPAGRASGPEESSGWPASAGCGGR